MRTRFAPSPTGSLHVGGARTALYNYLFARKHQGTFVLRIEDTDVVRSTEASEKVILDDLKWLGLQWDEGPDAKTEFGPYRQSERSGHYAKIAEVLKKSSLLYRCYCTEEELTSRRKAALAAGKTPLYDGTCRNLTDQEIQKRGWRDRTFGWRFNIHAATAGQGTQVTVPDLIHGDIHFDSSLIGDFIVIKSNGTPSYNFACVVDDYEMKITHVIRGDEHLTNTPRQILLSQVLGWDIPKFAHLPMILAADRTKLSKRHGTTAVGEFKDKGYLPHAILNYVALLGWSPKDERELFVPPKEYARAEEALQALLTELSQVFSLEGVSKNSAVFDTAKLNWMNSQYLRLLKPEELARLTLPFLGDSGTLRDTSGSVPRSSLINVQCHSERSEESAFEADLSAASRPRDDMENIYETSSSQMREKLITVFSTQRNNFETLLDAVSFVKEFLTPAGMEMEETAKEVFQWPWTQEVLASFEKAIHAGSELTAESVSPLMKKVQAETGKKGKDLFWPIRAALSGKTHGPELVHLLPLLGKNEILTRIEKARKIILKR